MPTKSTILFNISISPENTTFLRMDGRRVLNTYPAGGGVVNCQWGHYTMESFAIISFGNDIYSFESNQFPNRYLRNDLPGGQGVVNCQFWSTVQDVGPNEKYLMHRQVDGTYFIESIRFPKYFLNMDGKGGNVPSDGGFGEVKISKLPQKLFILPIFDEKSSS